MHDGFKIVLTCFDYLTVIEIEEGQEKAPKPTENVRDRQKEREQDAVAVHFFQCFQASKSQD